jgi:hypothetical protein
MTAPRLFLCLSILCACQADKDITGDDPEAVSAVLEVYPPLGGQGQSMEVHIDASRSVFDFSGTQVDFGDGIFVESVDVDDGFGLRAQITIEADAELGSRDVGIDGTSREFTLDDSFEVIAQSFVLAPSTARIGETLSVDILGHQTEWVGGVTWPSFGDGIEVSDFTVLSGTLAVAEISVSAETAPGWRNVVMDNGGGDRVTLYDGFKVDRVALAATFEPTEAEQGKTVEFTVRARDTDFTAGIPSLDFFDRFGENPDIIVDTITVLDSENLYGQMTLSNAAALGMRDVLISTGDEGVYLTDAFEVVGGDWSLEEVAIDLSFYVVRSKDNETGEVTEAVRSYCTFYIPLDPPCPTGGGGSGSGSGMIGDPTPYDINSVFGATGEGSGGGEEDCPYPTTISAGDYVWLESDANIVTLEKTVDTASGIISYAADGLTFDDYVPNNWYDLHTQGDDEGIGEYILDGVQPTVPSDWEWVSPDLWGNYTQNRAEDFEFSWTPAQTYPDALFVVTLFSKSNLGPLVEENWFGYLGVYPMDDGSHQFLASELSQFAAGGAPLSAYSIIGGPEFGLPESIYQSNVAVSYIFLSQYLVLE